MDQKWRDSLNVVAAEPTFTDYIRRFQKKCVGKLEERGPRAEQPKKGQAAEVNAATAEVTERALRAVTRPVDRAPRKCKLAEVIGCTGSHLPWLCKAFGDKTPEERTKLSRITSSVHSVYIMALRSVLFEDLQDQASLPDSGVQRASQQMAPSRAAAHAVQEESWGGKRERSL